MTIDLRRVLSRNLFIWKTKVASQKATITTKNKYPFPQMKEENIKSQMRRVNKEDKLRMIYLIARLKKVNQKLPKEFIKNKKRISNKHNSQLLIF